MIKTQVAEKLKTYTHERITAWSSVTYKENVTKNCMVTCIIKICVIMGLNYGALLFAADFIAFVKTTYEF